jgi:glutamate/aspartate transport system permease protein
MYNILLTILAVVIALPIACVFALARLSHRVLIYYPATLYIHILRSSPLIMVLFWIYYAMPVFLGCDIPAFYAALFAITIFEIAYFAEFIRAGLQAISVRQREAGLSTGLKIRHVSAYIILPQAIRKMLPSLLTQSIIAFQDSTLASIIGMREIFQATRIINSRFTRSLFLYSLLAIVFFAMCFCLSSLVRRLEKRVDARTAG